MSTSWQKSGKWYNKLVGDSGHHFHQAVIFPRLKRIFNITPSDKVLDLGCGNGVLARQIPESTTYFGLDSASSLVKEANQSPKHRFFIGSATQEYPFPEQDFTHAVFLLSLQNMDAGEAAISLASKRLKKGGKLALVLNHPTFRIPRQSSWGIDQTKKTEYRRIDRYLTPLKIPITMHPGQEASSLTWSYHHPLSDYFLWLHKSGLTADILEEWTSDKESVGRSAKMENRSRSEFPLFLAIIATKK